MKLRHWILVGALALAVPAAYVGAFVVGLAIGWNKVSKRPVEPITIRFVDRVAPAPGSSVPASSVDTRPADATP